MKCIDIINRALLVLGYTNNDSGADLNQRIMIKAVAIANLVYSDLCRICGVEQTALKGLNDKILLPEKAADAFVCGVASYIAGSEGDGVQQSFWAEEYQNRRLGLSGIQSVKDTVPTV